MRVAGLSPHRAETTRIARPFRQLRGSDPGPETPPGNWTLPQAYHKMKRWLFLYVRSRVLPGEFHPIIAYLFVEYKCNLVAGTAGPSTTK
jgi:hypothetical protein